jgi:hypothetical protein
MDANPDIMNSEIDGRMNVNLDYIKAFGVTEGFVLQVIENRLQEAEETGEHRYKGKHWAKITLRDIQARVRFRSFTSIEQAVYRLKDKGVLTAVSGVDEPFDQTRWYRIDHDKLNEYLESSS